MTIKGQIRLLVGKEAKHIIYKYNTAFVRQCTTVIVKSDSNIPVFKFYWIILVFSISSFTIIEYDAISNMINISKQY